MNEKGALVPANIFDKVTYHLHPSFGERATQGMFRPYCVFSFWESGDPESYGRTV